MRPRLSKAVSGLAVGAATLALVVPPASAHTVSGDVVGGSIEISNADDALVTSELSGSGVECTPLAVDITLTGDDDSGDVDVSLATDSAISIGTTHFRLFLTAGVEGTYSDIGLDGVADFHGERRRVGRPPPHDWRGSCLPVLEDGDIVIADGTSGPETLLVSGNATSFSRRPSQQNGHVRDGSSNG
jgi:hypothetical protein